MIEGVWITLQVEVRSDVKALWEALLPGSAADPVFGSPAWAEIWHRHFGDGWMPRPLVIDSDGQYGLAPLMQRDGSVKFHGGWDVTDSFECVVPPDAGPAFYELLLDRLGEDWRALTLHGLRPESPTLAHLPAIALARGFQVSTEVEETSPVIELPGDWESYIQHLPKKDRHELRRKLRRLFSEGNVVVQQTVEGEALDAAISRFFAQHRISRHDKAEFMTPQMEAFFREIVDHFAAQGMARVYELLVDGTSVSSVVCFDHSNTLWLYNSGYDPEYAYLSVGLLLKALCVKDAIESGRTRFDFLRGAEPYKYHLGGQDVPLTKLVVERS